MELKLNETIVEEGKGKDWYMANTANLAHVTAESSNKEVGILKMTVRAPKGDAKKARVVAHVEVESILGWFNVTVFHSKDDASNLYLAVDSRKYVDEQGKEQYFESIRLKPDAKAQILRHVRSLCGETETQAVAQPQAQTPAGIDPALFAQFQAFIAMQAQAQQQGAGAVQASAPAQPTVPGIIGSGQGGIGTF